MITRERFYEIDLFRFLAALSVVFFHYTFRGYSADNMSSIPFPMLASVTKYGYLGLELFFMISGFVILLTASYRGFGEFVISRITRLYPAFWAAVTITSIVTIFYGGSRFNVDIVQYIANLSMVSGFFGVKAVDGVYWTLLVEIRFYLLIAIILLLNQVDKIAYFLASWLMVSVLCAFHPLSYKIEFFLIPEWASYFISGAIFYLIRRDGFSIFKVVLVLVSFFLSLKYAYGRIPEVEGHYHTDFSFVVISSVIAVFYGAMLLVSMKKLAFLNKKKMVTVGALTYPLYLIHQNVGFMLFNQLGEQINKYILLATVLVLMLAVSYLINRFVENTMSMPLKMALRNLTKRWRTSSSPERV